MRTLTFCALLGGAAMLAGAAMAADREAGVPLTPGEAAGAWTIESQGRDVCVLYLGAAHSVRAPQSCAGALPGQPTGWAPTADGMRLTGPGGQTVLAFNRWSNSLFVSHMASGVDIQLRRGTRAAP